MASATIVGKNSDKLPPAQLFEDHTDMGFTLLPGIISLALTLALGIPAAKLAERLGVMDVPGSAPHKRHARPTPLAGGMLTMVALLSLTAAYRASLDRDILAVLVGTLIVFAFGLWDDRRGLSAGPKLIGQLIASIILIASGVQVRFMTVLLDPNAISPAMAQLLNVLITLFWLVGITNAMNLIDSMDGIVAGLGVIASAFFLGAARLSHQPTLTFMAAGLFGICAGLYFWNAVVVKFFLGDSGAQTIGFLLACFGILYNPLGRSPESSWIVPIMLLSVPIFDTTLVALSRLRRKQPIGTGRRDHTFHRFIMLGIRPRYAVLIVHLTLTVSVFAYFTLYLEPWLALILFMTAILSGIVFLIWLERKPALDLE
ncbi:MAG: undecaprenyl/decaprenyl-phosphate alpha-N-acetylglucosaminyl 1-phosphate transferase [Chloroflexi bacterium]|nr:MAG: undecaprenyl/decaprenyl-phosphate alpha-N-acetylglucosaminyl 1-phosphate transferase [Chloroflexota bacterium]